MITFHNNIDLLKKVIFYYIFSKIQLVAYYPWCILIGWDTTRLYVIVAKSAICFVSISLTN